MSRPDKRVIAWGVVAALLAAAFLLAYAPFGDAAEEPVIDTAAPVDATQCAPCHYDLGSVEVPGLKFGHGNHLLVSCESCHARMPHRGGATERIPMEVCFACHGLQHQPRGELATGECEDCHTKSFELRPASHVEDWAERPHVDMSEATGLNDCMMCHDAPEDCDACHADKAPDVGPMPNVYHSVIYPRDKGPSVKIYPQGQVTMSQCAFCHPDLDDFPPGRLIFAHADHLRRNYSCESCHPSFPHTAEGAAKPDMLSCYRCHGVQHAGLGEVATEECASCHPKEFELVPENHTKKFIAGQHKKEADKSPEYCAMCHPGSFCVDCHRGGGKSPNAPDEPVIPADHKKPEWIRQHGGLYLDGEGACGSCHTDESCKRCHETPMPHPVGWLSEHKPAPGVTNEDCNVCHTDRSTCQSCHHETVSQGLLIEANCTPCHPEMKKKPATSIKIQGYAEHAVHFGVAEQTGEPYTCEECHVGFSTSPSSQEHQGTGGPNSLAQAGHDVRLCYGCHGALDLQNRQIAPWPGVELCIRCHTDINV